MELALVNVPTEEYAKIISQLPENFLGDFENGCVCSFKTLAEDSWVRLANKIEENHRLVHCVPYPQIEDNKLIAREDVYFNICRALRLNPVVDSNLVVLHMHHKDFFPPVADSVKISPVIASCDFTNEDEETLLHSHFIKPRFLCLGDVIQISITKGNFLKCPSYRGVGEVYFKVTSASLPESNQKENTQGFYVVKGYSDLYCLTGSPSFLPPKSTKLRPLTDPSFKRVSPDLEPNVSKLRSLFTPFIKAPIGCLPFFILAGPCGSGKLVTVNLVGHLLGLHTISLNAYEFCNVGVSAFEAKLDYLLQKATKIGPCILTITNLELIGRDKHGQEDPRLIDSFLSRCMSALKSGEKNPLLFVGITDNKTEDLLPSISRAAIQVIKFKVMDSSTAMDTLIWMTKKRELETEITALESVAKKLTGFLQSDLSLLLDHAVRNKHNRASNDQLNSGDFQYAIDLMEKAYSDTIGVAKVPDVKWDDVGGLTEVKEEIKLTLNMTSGAAGGRLRRSGILFYGPPGTGKTLMAKAVATECSMNFLSVKGPELMNMYVGQSERNVREVFERGREAAPCILFFDELDSLAPNRGKSDGGGVTDRVVSQLLAEMDGLHSNRGLFVIAATNRPDLVDSALLRPGRFDKMFYLGPLAATDAKVAVLKALTSRFVFSDDASLNEIAEACPDCVTGADLYSVCSNAWLSSARRALTNTPKGKKVPLPLQISMDDFLLGISQMVPSLTPEDLLYYQQLASSTSSK